MNKTKNIGQIKFLNLYGDITIEWDKEDNKEMEKFIQEKLDEGYYFYIVEKKFFGLFSKEVKINKINEIKNNKILIKDQEIENLLNRTKTIKTIKDNTDTHKIIRVSNNTKEIATSTTVCIKPPQRG